MTNKEAVEVLKISRNMCMGHEISRWDEAFKMAKKALEKIESMTEEDIDGWFNISRFIACERDIEIVIDFAKDHGLLAEKPKTKKWIWEHCNRPVITSHKLSEDEMKAKVLKDLEPLCNWSKDLSTEIEVEE